jgi:hypothetical protein
VTGISLALRAIASVLSKMRAIGFDIRERVRTHKGQLDRQALGVFEDKRSHRAKPER